MTEMYGLSLVLPLANFVFLVAAPHAWALLWLAVPGLLVLLDVGATRHPPARGRLGPLLYAHAALQLANVVLLARLASVMRGEALVGVVLVGIGSAYAGVVVAHELIHRRAALVGRAVLVTLLYEHFFTEHLRGHHVRVGTPEDAGTAHRGETFFAFLRRAWPGEIASAWRIDRRAVLVGVLAELALAGATLAAFGPAALGALLAQAAIAHLFVFAVNYFEHWGIVREGRRVTAAIAWQSDAWLTHFALLGLPRHADHHLHAARPFPQLARHEDSPRLPHGYFRMVFMVLFRNAAARRAMERALIEVPRSSGQAHNYGGARVRAARM